MSSFKSIVIVAFITVLSVLTFSDVHALDIVDRGRSNLDEGLADDQGFRYAYPEKIYVHEIKTPYAYTPSDDQEWLGELYYHFITRLGFIDMPYNYIVGGDGQVYQGRRGYEIDPSNNIGIIPDTIQDEGGVVLIGVLGDASSGQSSEGVTEIIQSVISRFNIPPANINMVDLEIVREDGATPLLTAVQVESQLGLKGLDYTQAEQVSLEAQVDSVEYTRETRIGSTVQVSVEVSNTGEYPWLFAGEDLYLVTSDGQDSDIAVNGEWASFDTVFTLADSTVLPGDSLEFEFNVQIPLRPGRYVETFNIRGLGSPVLKGSQFQVEMLGVKGDLKIVEIIETGTGYLNVREQPFFSSAQKAQIDVGEVYITTDRENGWYLIEYEPGISGWVSSQYVREL